MIDEGILKRGSGHGSSISRIVNGPADAEESGEDDFALTSTSEPAPRQPKLARRPDGAAQVLSYRHDETRVNNPEVGMVHAGTDPDGEKATPAFDPHLDPVLDFDSARAGSSG